MYTFLAFHITVCVCACVYIYGIYIKYFTYILKYIKTYTSVDIYAHLKYTYILNLYTLIFVYMHIWNLKKLDFAFILIFEDWSWTSFNSINMLLQHQKKKKEGAWFFSFSPLFRESSWQFLSCILSSYENFVFFILVCLVSLPTMLVRRDIP